MIFSLDTNLLVDAMRSATYAARLAELVAAVDEIALSSVVVSEIEAGLSTARARRALEEGPVASLLLDVAIEAPGHEDWLRAGRFAAERPAWARSANRQNDLLLAMQCARRQWILVTRDADFEELLPFCPGLHLVTPRTT